MLMLTEQLRTVRQEPLFNEAVLEVIEAQKGIEEDVSEEDDSQEDGDEGADKSDAVQVVQVGQAGEEDASSAGAADEDSRLFYRYEVMSDALGDCREKDSISVFVEKWPVVPKKHAPDEEQEVDQSQRQPEDEGKVETGDEQDNVNMKRKLAMTIHMTKQAVNKKAKVLIRVIQETEDGNGVVSLDEEREDKRGYYYGLLALSQSLGANGPDHAIELTCVTVEMMQLREEDWNPYSSEDHEFDFELEVNDDDYHPRQKTADEIAKKAARKRLDGSILASIRPRREGYNSQRVQRTVVRPK
ncbi:hypothetical protein BU25DRAFT_457802 [Macroventuria anomochaeta]|uniref:Uncharacterized protein n=1 Tax=Macroventuria anomochaeta TaxID=301207 RepID=A0ACB6S378_9PLEO|nr:uncharacterized protein BU25DRAFT_457802 [Macroventuria anomochaeta]KAF2628488.1 hypothetical protein BU25DRAFT_457802 [Macroventuria anomochaeta]